MISQFSSGWVPRGKSLYFFAPCRAMNKKQCSRPLTKRDESMTNQSYFRGATHIRSRQSLPGPSNPILLRWDKAADVSGAVVLPTRNRGPLPAWERNAPCGPLCPVGGGTLSPSARYANMWYYSAENRKVNRKNYCRLYFCLGLTIFRQSRSPRSIPSTSISAVATLEANGTLF